MKLTNRMQLPQPLVDAVANDGYTRGDADLSVTQLISPPRKIVLERAYADKIEEDVSDRIWSLMGQAIHTILERANSTGIAERRLSITVQGMKISGGMDAYYPATGLLCDYKTTSVYKLLGDGVPVEWTEQQNIYAHMLRANGDTVSRIEVVAILRDWSKSKARLDPLYPQCQVATVLIPLWTPEKAAAFINDRVVLHKQAALTLPQCTPDDRWERPGKFAVMKIGGKRAVRLYETEAAAKDHASMEPNLFVEPRPGESVRCMSYCSVSKHCDQFQRSIAKEVPTPVKVGA